ncbi:GNAT family N-acetyltransferase [Nonomuraea sp. NPDC000554]|uniref:GNAT family N-acetyltransferase n=1 Tax=Nonomuraea sp. NPDC000554 TaxID=3154259 RepID=UPI00332A47E8
MIRELLTLDEVRAAGGDDDLLVWAAQRLSGGARAWALGDAVVAAGPGASRRDRLGVWGGTSCAVELVRHALAEVGPTFRPFGEAGLMAEVAAEFDGVEVAGGFSWMSLGVLPAPADVPAAAPAGVAVDETGGGVVGWLGGDADAEVAALLAAGAPDSYAVPGAAGVSRWAGLRIGGGLAAVAADAWSAPSVGLLAGVATAAAFRGRGLAGRVCRWVSRELVAAHGRAALMVDDDNSAAIAVYERIGYSRRRVLACHVTT